MCRYEIIEKEDSYEELLDKTLDKSKKCFGAHHALLEELRREDPNSYKNFLRMSDEAFQELLHLVTPLIKRKDTIFEKSAMFCKNHVL
jgi:hypothetical protein